MAARRSIFDRLKDENGKQVIQPANLTFTDIEVPEASKPKSFGTSAQPTVQMPSSKVGASTDLTGQLAQLEELRRQAAVDLDVDTVNRIDNQLKEMRAHAGQQTFGDRASDVLSNIMSGTAAGFTNTAGFAANAYNDPAQYQRSIKHLQDTLAAGRTTDGKVLTDAMRQTIQNQIAQLQQKVKDAESPDSLHNRIYKAADTMAADSQAYLDQAKSGLGAVGSTVVDATSAFGQSMLTGALGAATGTGMLPFAVQSFGAATQDARLNGATLDEQLMVGGAQAAKEYMTEKLFGLAVPQQIAGAAGSADDLIKKGIRAVTERLAKGESGQQILGGVLTWLAGGATEALEEGIGALVEECFINPQLKGYTEDTRTREEKFEDGLYNMLVGGLSGLLGVTNLLGYTPGAVDAKKPGDYNKTTTPVSHAAAPVVQQMEQQAEITQIENPESDVLSAATTLFVQQGMKLKTAQQKAEIVEKLIAGKQVTVREINKLEPTNRASQAIFTQLTGVQFPEGKLTTEQLYNLYRSAHDVSVQAQKDAVEQNAVAKQMRATEYTTAPETQDRIDKASKDLAAQVSNIDIGPDGNPLASLAQFTEAYRSRVNPAATDTEIRDQYKAYRNDSRTVNFGGHRLTRSQFTKLFQSNGKNVSEEALEAMFNRAILDTLDGGDSFDRYTKSNREGKAGDAALKLSNGGVITRNQFKKFMRGEGIYADKTDANLDAFFNQMVELANTGKPFPYVSSMDAYTKEEKSNVRNEENRSRSGVGETPREAEPAQGVSGQLGGLRPDSASSDQGGVRSGVSRTGGSVRPGAGEAGQEVTDQRSKAEALRALNPDTKEITFAGLQPVQILPRKYYTEEMKRLDRRISAAGGRLRMVMGSIVTDNGFRADGMFVPASKDVLIRADANVKSVTESGGHELIHLCVSQDSSLLGALWQDIMSQFESVSVDQMYAFVADRYKVYERAYGPFSEDNADFFCEEFIADVCAGLNDRTKLRQEVFDLMHRVANTRIDKWSEERVAKSKETFEKENKIDQENSDAVSGDRVFSATTETSWVDQILDVPAADPRGALYIRETPHILSEVGLGDLPMCMTVAHAQDILHEKDASNIHWHGIAPGLMQRLPELLSQPVMILNSRTRHGDLLVVLNANDNDGFPLVVSIHPNGSATVDGIRGPANFITSCYGRENFAPRPGQTNANNLLYLALANRDILYWNKSRMDRLARRCGFKTPLSLNKVPSDEILKQRRGAHRSRTPARLFSAAIDDYMTAEQEANFTNLVDNLDQHFGAKENPYNFFDWFSAYNKMADLFDMSKTMLDFKKQPFADVEVMDLGFYDSGNWVSVAQYPKTPEGLEQFGTELDDILAKEKAKAGAFSPMGLEDDYDEYGYDESDYDDMPPDDEDLPELEFSDDPWTNDQDDSVDPSMEQLWSAETFEDLSEWLSDKFVDGYTNLELVKDTKKKTNVWRVTIKDIKGKTHTVFSCPDNHTGFVACQQMLPMLLEEESDKMGDFIGIDYKAPLPVPRFDVKQRRRDLAELQQMRVGFTPLNENFYEWFNDDSGELTLANGLPKVVARGTRNAGATKGRDNEDAHSRGTFFTDLISVAKEYASTNVTVKSKASRDTAMDVVRGRITNSGENEWRPMRFKSWGNAVNYVRDNFTDAVHDNGLKLVGWDPKTGKLLPPSKAKSFVLRTNVIPVEAREPDASPLGFSWRTLAEFPATPEGLEQFNRDLGDHIRAEELGIRAYAKFYLTADKTFVFDNHGKRYGDITESELPIGLRKGHPDGSQTINDLVEMAFKAGYDCVVVHNVRDSDSGNPDRESVQTQYIVKSRKQFKSVYNSGAWSKKDPDFLFSAATDDELTNFLKTIEQEYGGGSAQKMFEAFELLDKSRLVAAEMAYPESVGAAPAGFSPYYTLMGEYGHLEPGENPSRVFDAPASTDGRNRVSLTARTVGEAKATPDSRLENIEQAVVDGKLTYIPLPNDIATRRANQQIQKDGGFRAALTDWTAQVRAGKTSPELVAMGAVLLNNAGNGGMSGTEYVDLLTDYSELVRNSARATQAARILKTLTPTAQLYAAQRYVDKMNDQMRGSDPAHNVPVEQWMQKTGENLADRLHRATGGKKSTAKTTAQIILSDLNQFALTAFPAKEKSKPRSERDRLKDLFDNYENYSEAWEAAKTTIRLRYADQPDALTAFENWLETDLMDAFLGRLFEHPEIRIDTTLADRFIQAKTAEDRDAALDDICKDIARQVPATLQEKFTALRYLNMLGNFKTQIRNVIGNAAFVPVRWTKNMIGTVLEARYATYAGKHGKTFTRSKSFTRDPEIYKRACRDFEDYADIVLNGGKYDDSRRFSKKIEDHRRIFKNQILEKYRRTTNWAMNNKHFGDEGFCRFAYAEALAGYLTANRVSFETASEELLDQAREYALVQAAEATYRDRNAFSDAIANLRFRNPDNLVKRGINAIGDGLLPFRRTPANILVRAIEYNPVGLLTTLAESVYTTKVKREEMDATRLLDLLAKNLTGTGLAVLGYLMFGRGLLRGKDPDDEREADFEELLGHQAYSIELPNGMSLTLDWLAPASIPLFLGAQFADAALEDGWSFRAGLEALGGIADPMLQMSMLQGVNDALENASTYGQDSAITRFTGNALWSYMTQGLTNTMLGQLERSLSTDRSTTFTDKEGNLPNAIQRLLGQASAKTPFIWDYQQIPYIDAWGRVDQNAETAVGNALQQFLVPAYVSQVNESQMEAELRRLYEATGNTSVFPKRAESSFDVPSGELILTAEQYVDYGITRGQTAYAALRDLTTDPAYKSLDDKTKATAAAKLNEFANAYAKAVVTGNGPAAWNADEVSEDVYDPDNWVKEATEGADQYGISVATYAAVWAVTKDITGITDKNTGKTIRLSESLRKAQAIRELDLPDAHAKKMMEYLDISADVWNYSKADLRSRINALEKKAK